jgi:hypothetical protein
VNLPAGQVSITISIHVLEILILYHMTIKLFLKTSKTVVIQLVYIKLLKTDSDLCPYKLLRKFRIDPPVDSCYHMLFQKTDTCQVKFNFRKFNSQKRLTVC